jgi:hypothetical protein
MPRVDYEGGPGGSSMIRHRTALVVGLLAATALIVAACGGGRRYRPLFGWASVPACQAAIRSRAFSEFGKNADIEFDAPAEEKRVGEGRVRVTGTAMIERGKNGDIPIAYECVTQPKRSKLISAKYSKRN